MSWLEGLEHIVLPDEPLGPRCWLRIGGNAEYFAQPTNEGELVLLTQRCRQEDISLRLLGGGSNLLISDAGVKGIVLCLDAPAFADIRVEGNVVIASGAASLSHVITSAVREGLAGMEPLVGIPGTVGGALHGNTGDGATDVGSWVQQVTALTRNGETVTRNRDEMIFAYRTSSLNELAILSAQFRLEEDSREELTRRMQKLWIMKRACQPMGGQRTACLFKDPLGMSASELIDQAGLKNTRFGGVSLFDRDANFVILGEDASSDDVVRMIHELQAGVSRHVGVDLETSIQIW